MRAKKSLGQNFLVDETVSNRIVDALDLRNDDVVLEIGPGLGALTRRLLEDTGAVIAVEFDRDMIAALRERFNSCKNLELINDDALNIDVADILETANVGGEAKLVANLPYNISTPILQRLIDQRHLFSTIVLMFQREVVERITASPGGRERGFLSVLVEHAFETEYLFDVAPQAFQPIPKVWSAVVRLTPKRSLATDESLFRKIVSVSFSQKRKNILNNLRPVFPEAAAILERTAIDGGRRAETLRLEEWIRVYDNIRRTKMPGLWN